METGPRSRHQSAPTPEPAPAERALELAYRYLNRRDRTFLEVRRHLERRGFGAAEVDGALAALGDHGYLDDQRFARVFAEDRRNLEQWGGDRIRRNLLERGVERSVVEAVIDEEPPESARDRALGLLQRRFPSPPREARDRDRAIGMLLRKGYELELALDALSAHASAT